MGIQVTAMHPFQNEEYTEGLTRGQVGGLVCRQMFNNWLGAGGPDSSVSVSICKQSHLPFNNW